jgi:hypothetical protein
VNAPQRRTPSRLHRSDRYRKSPNLEAYGTSAIDSESSRAIVEKPSLDQPRRRRAPAGAWGRRDASADGARPARVGGRGGQATMGARPRAPRATAAREGGERRWELGDGASASSSRLRRSSPRAHVERPTSHRGGEAAPRAGSGEREKRGGVGGGGRSGEEQVPDPLLHLRLPRRLPWPPCRRCRHALPDAPHLGSLDPIAAGESISRRRSPPTASTSPPLGKAGGGSAAGEGAAGAPPARPPRQ